MKRLPVEEAEKDLSNLMAFIQGENNKVCITSNEGNAILLSEETYNNLVVTLELLATPGLMDGLKVRS